MTSDSKSGWQKEINNKKKQEEPDTYGEMGSLSFKDRFTIGSAAGGVAVEKRLSNRTK